MLSEYHKVLGNDQNVLRQLCVKSGRKGPQLPHFSSRGKTYANCKLACDPLLRADEHVMCGTEVAT